MAQFDVYRNPSGAGFLLDVQANLLDELKTRVVVPLLPLAQLPKPAKRLNPVFRITNGRYVMVTQWLAAIPLSELEKRTTNLAVHRDEIIGALDMMLTGV